jgi:hypothetical protein
MKKLLISTVALVASAPLALAQEATTPVDLSSLSDAVDFASVITAVLAIAGAVISVLVVMKGIRWVNAMVR